MKHILIISFSIAMFFSCNSTELEHTNNAEDSTIAQMRVDLPKLYIKTFTTIGTGDKQKQTIDTLSVSSDISKLTSTFLET